MGGFDPDEPAGPGAEMGVRIAAVDWAATSLGPVQTWPQSLRTAVSICLHSRFPILLWWGPDLVMIYNDAYQPILGASKRAALGRPGASVWPEVWHIIGPMLGDVLAGRGATWSEDQLLLLDRNGYLEECFFTFSYSPVMDDAGVPEGVFTAVTETTDKVVGARRLRTLTDLAATLVDAKDPEQVARRTMRVLARDADDVTFAELHLPSGDGFTRLGATDRPPPAAGEEAAAGEEPDAAEEPLPLAVAAETRTAQLSPPSGGSAGAPRPATVVLPVIEAGGDTVLALLVLGISRRRPYDRDYRGFVDLLAGHVATALAGVRAYQAQRERAEALAELDAAKTVFFSNASHELRTPLTLIAGPLRDVLDDRRTPLADDHRRRLQLVERSTGRLRRLVDSLLDLARLEAGRLVPQRVAVDLGRLTREIAAVFEPAVTRAGLAFDVRAPRLPRPAYVDVDMWEKVVLNLLSNALKATMHGGLTVVLQDDDGQVRLTVRDTGVGIPADQLPLVFDRFFRVAGPTARSAEGTGLGLALVQELVGVHDGTVTVGSVPGQGATFTVRLPYGAGADAPVGSQRDRMSARHLAVPAAGWSAAADGAVDDGPADAPRVLVVDDNVDLRGYVADLLRPQFRVRTAADGRAALSAIVTERPDLVVADVMMPGMSGFDLLSSLRQDPDTAHLPVILLSARAGPEATAEGLAAGAADYLVKPFSGTELVARVQAALVRSRARQEERAWAAELTGAVSDGVFVSDENGVVVEVNDAWTRIVGYGPDALPYPPPYPWWPDAAADPADRAVLDAALVHLLDEGSGAYEVPLRHRDGRRVWVSITVTTVRDPVGGRGLMVGTVRDVTGRRRARQRQAHAVALTRRLSDAVGTDDVLVIAARSLAEAFDARVFLRHAPRDGEPADRDDVSTADGPVSAASVPPAVLAVLRATGAPSGPSEDAVPGIATRIRAAGQDWHGWIAFDEPRRVDADEHLLLGLLTAAAGQALQATVEQAEQKRVTDDLRQAARQAGERARAWRAEATARAEQVRAERRFRSLVEASTAVVWSADAVGGFAEPQPSFEAYTGQPWPEHGGTGWLRMLHPDDADGAARRWSRAVADGTGHHEDRYRIRHAADGTYRHVLVRATGIRADDGTLTEWIGTISDIHDRVMAEDAAQRSAAITDALLQASPVGFGWADGQLRLQRVNPALATFNGLAADAHLGRRPSELWPTDGGRIERLMRRALADGPVTGAEFSTSDADGDPATHRVASYFPISIAGSAEKLGVGFTIVDVTERTRLLRALGEERTRYEQLASTDVLAVFGGIEDRITEANDAFLSMLGYTVGDLRAGRLRLTPLTPPGWEEADRRAWDDLARTGRATALKKEYLHRDGHRVPVLIGVVALQPAPVRWLAYAADLTAEQAAQAELRLFKALVERSGDLIAVADVAGRLRYLNPAGRELTGLGQHAPPANLIDLVAPSARAGWRETLSAAVLDAGQHRGETAVLRHDSGAEIDVDQQAFTVAGDATDTRYLAVVARDSTDRQRSVRRAQALARFAGALSTAADRAAVMTAVATLSPAVFGAATAACAILGDAHDGLDVVGTGPHGTPARSTLTADADACLATAVRTNEPVDTVAGDGGPASQAAVTGCCVPLRYGDGAALGAIELCWPTPVARDGLGDLLDTVAGLTTQALQRAELTASAEAMATLAARLTVTRSPGEAIEVIVSEVPKALGAQLPGLALRDGDGRVRHYNAGLPAELAAAYAELSLDDPRPVVEVLRTGRRIVLPDRAAFRERYPDLVDHAGAYGVKTTVALPLLDSRGRPVAALGLGWTRRRHFDAADLARLDTVADLCEQTLERTRLVAAEHQLITRLAARLQTSPTTIADSLDIAVRYRPAMTGLNLGGDWYDLINLAGGRLAVVVGDVVGHHVEAAADMAQIRTLINTLIRLGVPLGQVFAQFTELVGREFWGTAVIMVVDPAAGRAEIARAGHPHPVLLRPGGTVELLATHRTPPLGLATGPTVTSTVAFAPGDTLIAYTDGLIERRDQVYDDSVAAFHAAAFHTAAVHTAVGAGPAAVAATDVADAMLAAATGTDDDQALVVIRHRAPAGKAPAVHAPAEPDVLLRAAFDAGTVSELRRTVNRLARRAGLDDAPLDDFTTAVYEVLTNAVRHGGGRGELVLRSAGVDLVCDVVDAGGGFADPGRVRTDAAPGSATAGGRGLWLARQLTDGLDISTGPDGVRASLSMRLSPG